jgi:hypothetical protein
MHGPGDGFTADLNFVTGIFCKYSLENGRKEASQQRILLPSRLDFQERATAPTIYCS